MPGFDRTGPEGSGSQTGRRLGKCNPKNRTNEEQHVEETPKGMGMRRGRGFGQGRGRGMGRSLGRGNA